MTFQIDEEGATTEFTYEDDCGCAMRRKQMIQLHPDGDLVTAYRGAEGVRPLFVDFIDCSTLPA